MIKWEYNGRKLANIFTILRRVLMLPIAYILVLLLYLVIYIGFGKAEADNTYNNIL